MDLSNVLITGGAFLITIAIGIIGHLLVLKDTAQDKLIVAQDNLIKDLYEKHNADADRLQKLELKVSENTYTKVETDRMLDSMKEFISDQFTELKESIQTLQRGNHA